jgi:asparagine synthase (glutamine-hydrolysing)
VVNGQGKRILIEALGDRLPPEPSTVRNGFYRWPTVRGQLREFLRDNVTAARFLERGMVSPEFLRTLLEEHDCGRRDNSHWLWSLLVLALWFQEMEQPAALPETVYLH